VLAPATSGHPRATTPGLVNPPDQLPGTGAAAQGTGLGVLFLVGTGTGVFLPDGTGTGVPVADGTGTGLLTLVGSGVGVRAPGPPGPVLSRTR
jgi:hypothetical protein